MIASSAVDAAETESEEEVALAVKKRMGAGKSRQQMPPVSRESSGAAARAVDSEHEPSSSSAAHGGSGGGLSSSTGLATNSIFFCFLFVNPSSGKHYSLPFLPATPSSPSRTLEGLFELTKRHSRALNSPRALLPELQRYKDTVRCGALGAEVPRHRQQQLPQTLIVRL